MKKFTIIALLLILTIAVAAVCVACDKIGEDKYEPTTVSLVTATGTVLCTISPDGSLSSDKIVYADAKGNVYSWIAFVNGEKVRVIEDEALVRNGEQRYAATTLGQQKIIVYPEKYYTVLNIAGASASKAIVGEVPRALPVSQKGYANFVGYYYKNAENEKVMLTDEKGNFNSPWSLNVKSLDLEAEFEMKPIKVKLNYGKDEVTNADESDVPQYLYYGDVMTFKFPIPESVGYEFNGWYTEETAGACIHDDTSYVNNVFKTDNLKNVRYTIATVGEGDDETYEVTMFARWKAGVEDVNYYDGEELKKTLKVQYGSSIPKIELEEKSGYTFMYWYSEGNEGTPYDFANAKMGVTRLNLYCYWKADNASCVGCGRDVDAREYAKCVAVYCPNCNTLFRGATAAHSFGETSIAKAASCGVEGQGVRTCSKCNEVENVVLPALEHNFVMEKVEKPTCSAQGYTAYKCSNCGVENINYNDEIVEHRFNTSVVEATEFKLGYTQNACVLCRASITNYFDDKGNGYIEIKDKEGLIAAAKDLTSNYYLTADIDLDGAVWTPWGLAEDGTYAPYAGIFNGNGHTVSNYTITSAPYGATAFIGEEISIGFFAEISGEVLDLKLEGTVVCAKVTAKDIYLGGVTGKLNEGGKITSVFYVGEVSLNDEGGEVSGDWDGKIIAGALVGLDNGTIEACSYGKAVDHLVFEHSSLTVYGYNHTTVGGLVGEIGEKGFLLTSTAYLESVLASSTVGDTTLGGIVGVNRGIFTDTQIVANSLTGTSKLQKSIVGGVVADNEGVALMSSVDAVSVFSQGTTGELSFKSQTVCINKGDAINLKEVFLPFAGDKSLFNFMDFDLNYAVPKPYVDYFTEKATDYVIDADFAGSGTYDMMGFDLTERFALMEGGVRRYALAGSYTLYYGNSNLAPHCVTVKGINYFFGEFDGRGNKISRFIFDEGSTSVIKYNYGKVKNLEFTFFYHKDKELAESDYVGFVDHNYGEVENCVQDGNYKIRMKKGLQIFLGIFVVIAFLCIIFGIESYILSEYEGGPFVFVAALICAAIAGICYMLGFVYGSTRLSVFMAITTAAMSLWPCIHTTYMFGSLKTSYYDPSDAYKLIPSMLIHWLALVACVSFTVVALKFM